MLKFSILHPIYEVSSQDVGGGSVSNEIPYSLARIPLRWMVRECIKNNTGILFHSKKFSEIGLDPASYFSANINSDPKPLDLPENFKVKIREKDPLPTSVRALLNDDRYWSLASQPFLGEEEEELQDTVSAIYDELEIHRLWWIIEYLPLPYRYQARCPPDQARCPPDHAQTLVQAPDDKAPGDHWQIVRKFVATCYPCFDYLFYSDLLVVTREHHESGNSLRKS